MHVEPLVVHRAQVGCSLEHLTLEAAQASQEALNLGLRSFACAAPFGADVDEDMMKVGMIADEYGGWCRNVVPADGNTV